MNQKKNSFLYNWLAGDCSSCHPFYTKDEERPRLERHIIASVKIFGRRPSSLVRHKHGGFNSTFPMNDHTVIQQAAIQQAFNQAIQLRAEAIKRAGGVENMRENNVLNFAERSRSLRHDKRLPRPTRRD